MIIYDLEIVKAIPNKDGSKLDGVQYCDGWHDHAGMGISVLCAMDTNSGRTRVFCEDNKEEFYQLMSDEKNFPLVSFNGLWFDNKVIEAVWGFIIGPALCYDILVEVWAAHGLGPLFKYPSHIGYGLDAIIKTNKLAEGKTGNGALAPVEWQRGNIGGVIDYCLEDVRLTKILLDMAMCNGELISPVTGNPFTLRNPTSKEMS